MGSVGAEVCCDCLLLMCELMNLKKEASSMHEGGTLEPISPISRVVNKEVSVNNIYT